MYAAPQLFVSVLLISADPSEEVRKQELEKLQGTWEVTAKHSFGRKTDADLLKKAQLTVAFQGDRFLITSFGRTEEYVIRLNCATSPKTFVATLVTAGGKATTDDHPDTWAYELGTDSIKVAVRSDGSNSITRIDPESKAQLVFIARRAK